MMKTRLGRSLAFRLALMYAAIGSLTLIAVLAASFLFLRGTLQRQLDQGLVNEVGEYAALLEEQNIDVMRDVLDREAESEGTDRVFFRILDTSGKEVLATDLSAWDGIEARRTHVIAATQGEISFDTLHHHDGRYAARIVYGRLAPDLIIQLGESTRENAEVLRYFRRMAILASVAFMVCSVIIGVLMARRALSGVHHITATAKDIASGKWESRVPITHRQDEIDELAAAFNEMIERIQILFRELREVTDDIAHDLRTPIARIRAMAEGALTAAGHEPTRSELAGDVLSECDRLLGLINTMLEISQTEAGATRLLYERLDISAIVDDVCDLFVPAAEDKGLTLECIPEAGLIVCGDPQRLKRALAHLVDNAIKYSDCRGAITVTVTAKDRGALVRIQDEGIGIPAGHIDRVFERFYRVDESRSQNGNGLGLSLSRAIFRAHGGDVTVTSAQGEGTIFTVSLPLTD